MAVLALFPTHRTIFAYCDELIVETAADDCLGIERHAPAVGNTLLHAQGTLGVPCTEHIGITHKVQTLALAQTAHIEREGHAAVVPVDAGLIERDAATVEETEKVCLFIVTYRRVEPHVIHHVIAVDAVETQPVRGYRPLVAYAPAIQQQFVAVLYVGILLAYLNGTSPPPSLYLAQRQHSVGSVAVVIERVTYIHDTPFGCIVTYVEFYEIHF